MIIFLGIQLLGLIVAIFGFSSSWNNKDEVLESWSEND
jgi:hypothetical protein